MSEKESEGRGKAGYRVLVAGSRGGFEFHNVAAQVASWLPRSSRGQPEPLARRASLPGDVPFGDNHGGSTLLFGRWLGEEGWASPDNFGAVLGPLDGRTRPCWTRGCFCGPAAARFEAGRQICRVYNQTLIPALAGGFKGLLFSTPVLSHVSRCCGALCGPWGRTYLTSLFVLWAQSCSVLNFLASLWEIKTKATSLRVVAVP